MQQIEDNRVSAKNRGHVVEHVPPFYAILNRFNISESSRVLNIDKTGCRFDRPTTRWAERGAAGKDQYF